MKAIILRIIKDSPNQILSIKLSGGIRNENNEVEVSYLYSHLPANVRVLSRIEACPGP